MMQAAQPTVAPTSPSAPAAPTGGKTRVGPFSDILDHLRPARRSGETAGFGGGVLRKSALPALALVARRLPVGLALLGVAAAGVALANPKSRARILETGRSALAALRR